MHEMSICANIIEIVEGQAKAQNFQRVCKLSLSIGQLAGIDSDALRFGFDIVARGSVAEAAELEIEEISGSAWCRSCSEEVPLPELFSPCPICSAVGLSPLSGTELQIRNIEVV